jgi:hypothetical protein
MEDRAETNRVETNRVETNRVETNSVRINSVGTNSLDTSAVGASGVEKSGVEKSRVVTSRVETRRAERDRLELGKTFGWMLTGLLALQLAISVPIAWVLDSYFDVNVPASLMYFGKDGWCDTATEGVGKHCFGDFHERFLIDPFGGKPWPNNLELSPIGPFFTGTANALANILPARLVLSLVILGYAACLLVPAVWAARSRPWPLRILIVGMTGIATYPFVATMDRLNSVALTVPLILAFLMALGAGNRRGVLFSILALTVVKPQFIVLYFVLIAQRKVRTAAVGVLASIASCTLLVVAAGGGDFGRISQWFAAASSYGNGLSLRHVQDLTPVNVSFSRVVYVGSRTLESLQHVVLGTQIPLWTVADFFLVLLQGSVFVVSIAILSLWGRCLPPIALGIAALVVSTLVLGEYVAGYYLTFALPVCALFLRRASHRESRPPIELYGEIDSWSEQSGRREWMQWSLLAATTLSCSLMVVPLLTSNQFGFLSDRFHRVAPMAQNLATAAWMLFLVTACHVAAQSFVKEEARIPPSGSDQPGHDLSKPN